jgi:phosphoribosylanthranilate isomerase
MSRKGKKLLKICGVTRTEDAAHCVRRQVAYVGFNLYPGSKRHVTAEAARAVWNALPDRGVTQAVAVVVDVAPEELARILAVFPELVAVQFHGHETPEQLARLKAALGGREAWKAVGIAAEADVSALPGGYAADLLLLDSAKIPAGASVMGGSGQAFEWRWIPRYSAPSRLGVAGGVRPANASALLAHDRVELIDVSSGVESAPGIKDHAAIDALLAVLA